MNRSIVFDSPFLLGFEHTRALIERAAKAAAESYPPYNVEAKGEGDLRITLAVAGFSPDQLTVSVEGRQLTIADVDSPRLVVDLEDDRELLGLLNELDRVRPRQAHHRGDAVIRAVRGAVEPLGTGQCGMR